jgi:hypothetical protein
LRLIGASQALEKQLLGPSASGPGGIEGLKLSSLCAITQPPPPPIDLAIAAEVRACNMQCAACCIQQHKLQHAA